MIACENAGHSILDQFPEVRNLVEGGVAPRDKVDYTTRIMQSSE